MRRASSSFGWREPGSASSRLLSAGAACGVRVVIAQMPVSAGRPDLGRKIHRARGRARSASASCDLGTLVSVLSEQLGDFIQDRVVLDLGPVLGHGRERGENRLRAVGQAQIFQRGIAQGARARRAGAAPRSSCRERKSGRSFSARAWRCPTISCSRRRE